ncbi:restriction endonuclease subunit S [Agathobacter rectalis]|jgi:type I restriction enzyme S subunit|uniref:Type I restriction enzyme EcoKI specificity protein n=2 Tax=Agathobacter rectalis TaxID=39491 RepID=A0A174GRU3_9FIRM|nr:restriction endonuclease subunit S [Agathobacter rectalis]CUO63898.1 Type I restriction enzyme EcoKI specificity protein [Agathobacter rectalis]
MDTKALRQKILDLAIRGKLVPQDPNDEPAEVLLERIREQKQQMFKEGKLKKKDIKNDTIIFKGEDNLHYEKFQDGTVKCIEDEIPFEVPEGWAWCKLNDIYNFIDYRGATPTKITNGIPLVTAKNVKSGYIDYTIDDYISEEEFKERQQRGISKKGDILFTTEAPLGNAALADMEKFSAGQRLITFQQYGSKNELINYVMLMFILSDFFQQQLYVNKTGSTVAGIKAAILKTLWIPVPPYNEQLRISNTLKSAINLIDSISKNKEILSTSISNTKSKILDLAIRGKIVPQDPNDEPASVLLERIRAEKEELIKQGKIKRDKKESVIFKGDDNSYYGIHLPDSWNWASLREIALSISDGSHNPPPNNGSGIPLLSAANINDNSILMNEISRWITNEEWKIENQRTNIEVGDVLLTIVGSIGRSAVVQNNNHFALQRSVAVIKPCLINPLYLMHIVQSPQIQKWLTDNSKGTAQKGIYLNALSLMIIPIPPLAEQARIVEHIHIAYKHLDLISNALL